MKPWPRNRDIQIRLQKKWNKGHFLSRIISDEPFKPLRIALKHPTASELTEHFDEARKWIAHLTRQSKQGCGTGYDLEWRETNHRALGRNKIPVAVVFSQLEDLLAYLGKTKEAGRFNELCERILGDFPELKALLISKPLEVLAHDGKWTELLAILSFLKKYSRPMIYIRQLEIPGVDTKFVEQHKKWLAQLLDRILPPQTINPNAQGLSAFEQRYGFFSKPSRIRFRLLDSDLYIRGLSDLQISAEDFSNLALNPDTVFIVENEINGLSLPSFPRALVIFGLGYGLKRLSGASWMKDKSIWYWGDIDTHGFAMLDQIRGYFPQTRSFLMDEQTLLTHRSFWGSESSPTNRELSRLNPEETCLYDTLKTHRFARSLRLEQERIDFSRVKKTMKLLLEQKLRPKTKDK